MNEMKNYGEEKVIKVFKKIKLYGNKVVNLCMKM